MKHTKGKWGHKVMRSGNEISLVTIYSEFIAGSKRIGTLSVPNSYLGRDDKLDDDTVQANARLIAAAPDMLEALIEVLKQIKYPQSGSSDRDGEMIRTPDIKKIEAAIDKATKTTET